MPSIAAQLRMTCLIFIVGLNACSIAQNKQAAVSTVQPAHSTAASLPTAASIPAATSIPTSTPTTVPPSVPTATPPTPTPDPWAAYAPYTIEALRKRTYGAEGRIEIVRVLEQTANFTRYLFAYPSDGLRITGMMKN